MEAAAEASRPPAQKEMYMAANVIVVMSPPGEAKPGLGVGKWQKWTACTVTGRLAGRFAPAVSVFCVVFI